MGLDFQLILVLAVFITGGVWLFDLLWFKKRRSSSVEHAGANGAKVLKKEPVIVEYSKSFFPVLFAVLILRSFLYEPFQIPSGSMLPTLQIGDFILVNKYHYGLRLPVAGTKVVSLNDPARGDVMVFKFPEDGKTNFIKRVVGLPGDRIRYENKMISINGNVMSQDLMAQLPPSQPRYQLLEEDLETVRHQIYIDLTPPGRNGEWQVPEGHYFVMGDNRDNSNDSRYWGFVPDELVVGKAVAVWMHWNDFFSLPSFAHVGAID
jgi:signal peptidase I